MASFNKVILMGNLTRDPELKMTPGGLAICKIGMAVNRSFKKADGTPVDETTYVDIDSFGKQAEVLAKYMTKGRPLMVEGRLKFDQWESNGEKRSKLGVVLETFQFLGSAKDGASAAGSDYADVSPPSREKPAAQPSQDFSNDDIDDDVPF